MRTCLGGSLLAFLIAQTVFADPGSLLLTGSVYERALTNGRVYLRYSTTNTYDVRGRLFQTTFSYDANGDRTNDYISTYSHYYDKHGAMLSSVDDLDFNADGKIGAYPEIS